MDNTNTERKVKLLKPHEHAGRSYPVGGMPTLPKRKADWLVGIKAAEELDGSGSLQPGAGAAPDGGAGAA